jgi:hypothetical protein
MRRGGGIYRFGARVELSSVSTRPGAWYQCNTAMSGGIIVHGALIGKRNQLLLVFLSALSCVVQF